MQTGAYSPMVCSISLMRITMFPVVVGSIEDTVDASGLYKVVAIDNCDLDTGVYAFGARDAICLVLEGGFWLSKVAT